MDVFDQLTREAEEQWEQFEDRMQRSETTRRRKRRRYSGDYWNRPCSCEYGDYEDCPVHGGDYVPNR